MKGVAKTIARFCATVTVTPALVSFYVRSRIIGPDRALEGSTQAFALIPGLIGRYLRVAFLQRVLAECDPSAAVEFGTLFSQCRARIEPGVYIGPRCHIGLAHIERDALLSAGVHVPSGPNTHGFDRLDVAIRDQPGNLTLVRIGAGSWIGSGAIVMADVGKGSVVAAGAVVTEPVPDLVVAAGVPARIIRARAVTAEARSPGH